MREPKFSFNAFLLVVLIFTALTLFITVIISHMADRTPVNDFYPIDGTEYMVHYSNLEPDGIYSGTENIHDLLVKGTFGYDWGAAVEGSTLYINEYNASDLGVTLCDLVRVDLNSFRRELLLRDTILRGRCASGELVCVRDTLLPSNRPDTNALCAFYAMTSARLVPGSDRAEVLFLDPQTGEIVFSVRDDDALSDFDARYLARTLEEVRG